MVGSGLKVYKNGDYPQLIPIKACVAYDSRTWASRECGQNEKFEAKQPRDSSHPQNERGVPVNVLSS